MIQVLEYLQQNQVESLIDIGANIGNFTRIVKTYFPNMDVLMCEANPFCDNMLKNTGYPYEIVCLSDSKKEVKFYLEDKNMIGTGASYYLEKTVFYSMQNHTVVQTETLDDFLKNKYQGKSFDFVKIDTQGSEIDIMKGGKETINKAKHVLLETSLIEYNAGAPLKKDYFEYMDSIGFKPIQMVEEHYFEGSLIQEDWIFSKQG